MRTQLDKSQRWMKWLFFGTFLSTVPVPYFMVVVGGLVPTIYILYLAVQGLFVAIPKFSSEGIWIIGIMLVHLVILGGLLYLISHGLTKILFRIFPRRTVFLVAAGLIVSLIIGSTFEIYRIPGHNSAPPANLTRILQGL